MSNIVYVVPAWVMYDAIPLPIVCGFFHTDRLYSAWCTGYAAEIRPGISSTQCICTLVINHDGLKCETGKQGDRKVRDKNGHKVVNGSPVKVHF
jgi:hypothetical protein